MIVTQIIRQTLYILLKFFPGLRYVSWITFHEDFSKLKKNIFLTPKIQKKKESFEKAIERLQMTQEDVDLRYQTLKQFSWYWLICCLLTLLYSIHLIIQQFWLGCLSSFVMTSITLSQFFRYHFLAFQIEKKQLGCTFQEWYQHYFSQFWNS